LAGSNANAKRQPEGEALARDEESASATVDAKVRRAFTYAISHPPLTAALFIKGKGLSLWKRSKHRLLHCKSPF